MKKIILVGLHGRPSTKLMYFFTKAKDVILLQRRQFKSKAGKFVSYYRNYNPENRDKIDKNDKNARDYDKSRWNTDAAGAIVVRWGSREIIRTDESTIIYNTSKAIANATNKASARVLMANKGVSVPTLVTPNNIHDLDESCYPIIGRPHVHSKGANMFTFNTAEEFLRHYDKHKYYYSEFIDKDEEFRVHVGHSKCIVLMEKMKPEGGGIAWNRAQAGTEPFENVRWNDAEHRGLYNVIMEGIKAVNALGLDMGAADVIVKDGKAYVLEVNTAPTLNSTTYTAERWAKYIDWIFRVDGRRPHFNPSSYSKAKSLFWKNFQLSDEMKPSEKKEHLAENTYVDAAGVARNVKTNAPLSLREINLISDLMPTT